MTWGEFLSGRIGHFVVLAALLVASGFFSGSETALFSLSPGQLYRLGRRGRGGRLAASLMAQPRELLQALLLGNHLVNVGFSSISAMLVFELRERVGVPAWGAVLVWLGPLLLLILLGEVLPKMLALGTAQRWATAAAMPLVGLRKVLWPAIFVVDRALTSPMTRVIAPRRAGSADISARELAALLDLSAKRGLLDPQANALLQEIFELTDLRVTDVMVPRVDVICYDVDAPRAGLVQVFRRTRLRRIPVYRRDVDHMLGVVHAKRVLLNPATPLAEQVVKVPFLPEAANLERALVQLRVRRSQTAIVVDEYGGTAGLVTLQDILEEIVGDIPEPREDDRGVAVEEIAPGRYVIDADLAIHEWADAFEIDLGGRRISTVGGFVTSRLGRIAAVGDAVTYRNLRFTVVSMRRRRIGKLELKLMEERG
jgi:putative hemolysin